MRHASPLEVVDIWHAVGVSRGSFVVSRGVEMIRHVMKRDKLIIRCHMEIKRTTFYINATYFLMGFINLVLLLFA